MSSLFEKQSVYYNFFVILRLWFASLLLYHGFTQADKDSLYMLLNWLFNRNNQLHSNGIIYLTKIIEWISGLLILLGLFTRICSAFIAILMFVAICVSVGHIIDFGGENDARTKIFFWLACIFLIYGGGKLSFDLHFVYHIKKESLY